MKNKLIAETSVTIDANSAQIWKALTTPALVKKYLMGTEVSTDWKKGSAIEYTGEYEGKKYHDKGVIQDIEPGKKLQTTYWSSMGGKPDLPENYNLVTYTITEKDKKCVVTLTQDNIGTDKEKDHAVDNWKKVLHKLKEVVEKG